jgi:aryl-alcohol dehydrogenase-like predicted oxidoreductase
LEKVCLGKSNISVSKFCFGTLTISPLQKNFSIDKGADLLKSAFNMGVTFFDTAQIYGSYPHLKQAFEKNNDVVISTKSYAYDEKTAAASLELARKGLGKDVIDIFMLHEQESELTLKGHKKAIDFFLKMKQKSVIRAFGVSTHHVACVKAALNHEEIEVIHPIYNKRGLGIADGSIEEMRGAMAKAHEAGIGIFAMKPLGGGHMCKTPAQAFDFVLGSSFVDAVAVGIQSEQELEDNIEYFSGNREVEFKAGLERKVMVHDWCTGCGSCVIACKSGAIMIQSGKASVDQSKCVFCGYCGAACKDFVIKVV